MPYMTDPEVLGGYRGRIEGTQRVGSGRGVPPPEIIFDFLKFKWGIFVHFQALILIDQTHIFNPQHCAAVKFA